MGTTINIIQQEARKNQGFLDSYAIEPDYPDRDNQDNRDKNDYSSDFKDFMNSRKFRKSRNKNKWLKEEDRPIRELVAEYQPDEVILEIHNDTRHWESTSLMTLSECGVVNLELRITVPGFFGMKSKWCHFTRNNFVVKDQQMLSKKESYALQIANQFLSSSNSGQYSRIHQDRKPDRIWDIGSFATISLWRNQDPKYIKNGNICFDYTELRWRDVTHAVNRETRFSFKKQFPNPF